MRKQVHTEYRGFRTPGIRLKEPLLPDIIGHSSEAELPLLYAYHMFDKAHLVMLAEEQLIPRADAAAMLRALRDMEAEGIEKVRLEVGGGMHSGEQYLIRRLGEEVGGRIHLGRSSGDLGAVARRIRQRDRLLELMRHLNELRATLLAVAEANLDAVMPGYTHSQHAQPVTLGHQLLAWASALERDFERAGNAYQRVNQSPAGAAIMTGSNFPLNRHRTAELLGFDGVIKNTFDAILNQDVALDSFLAVASVNLNLSKWAADLNFWFTAEAGYIDIPDRFCGTSSIMMQKKNPYVLEYMRGAVAESMGGLVTAFAVQKAATGDPVQDRRYMYEALFRSFDLAVRSLRWMTLLLPAIEVKKARMREMAAAYWATATDVAGALVREKGLPWRTAHQIVGILVRLSEERGLKPAEVTPALLDEAAVEYMGEPVGLSAEALQRALDPVVFVAERTLYGGPAPEECRRRLPDYHARLQADREAVAEKERRLQAAATALEKAIDALLA
ncbi:MAG: argininosuccinate lyase [Candidatus Tectimicrobiota bacterium]|nr:MAG: argininosuccinate lyase [Candidatus Tectomicrobia bacterium]